MPPPNLPSPPRAKARARASTTARQVAGSFASQGQGVPMLRLQAAARQATQGAAAAVACCGTAVCAPFLSCHQITVSA
ncbi:hypothetical protein HaLaN_29336, partial [Haematococcus lacustris]